MAANKAMDKTDRHQVQAWIQQVLAGVLSPADAVSAIETLPARSSPDRLIEDAYHLLLHYRDDEDIRASDPGYAELQARGLDRFLRKLESAST